VSLARIFENEEAARIFLEKLRWPKGAVCPYCGAVEATRLSARLHQCRPCRKQFTLTAGTIFSSSHVPLHKWLLAVKLMSSRRNGVTAVELQDELGLGTYQTAWKMSHRIRWAMSVPPLSRLLDKAAHPSPRNPLRIQAPFKTTVKALFELKPAARTKPKGDRVTDAKARSKRVPPPKKR